jgi:hypothetical protein
MSIARTISRASRSTRPVRCSLSRASHTGAAPSRGGGSRKLNCCMAVLRCRWQRSIRGVQQLQQSVDDRPGMQEISVESEECCSIVLRACTRCRCDGQVGPRRRYQGTGAIGQYQRQMELAAPMAPTKDIKRRSRKGMARPNDGDLIGIAIKMMAVVVGSLSSGLLTMSGTTGCWRKWLSGSTTRTSCICCD